MIVRIKQKSGWFSRLAASLQAMARLVAAATILLVANGSAFAAEPGSSANAAKQPSQYRIAVVLSSTAEPYRKAAAAVCEQAEKAGWQSRSIQLDDLSKDSAAVPKEPDAFIAVGTKAAVWLHANLTSGVPLVYCMTSDPHAAGLMEGRQACGVSTDVPLEAQFELISAALPQAHSVGLLYHSKATKTKALPEAIKKKLPAGWRLEPIAIDSHDSVAEAIETLLGRDIDIIWTFPDASVYNVATIRSLLLAAMRRKIPVFGFSPAFVRAGALLGVGINPTDQGQQATSLALRILSDRTKAPTPQHTTDDEAANIELAPKFEIAVNLIVAEKLPVELPEGLLKRARHVFKPEAKLK